MNYISETARLRYSQRFESVRRLLAGRGLDPRQILHMWCEQGLGRLDMLIRLALPTGEIVEATMREDAVSGQYITIVDWQPVQVDPGDEEDLLARQIVTSRDTATAFDKAVESFNHFRNLCR